MTRRDTEQSNVRYRESGIDCHYDYVAIDATAVPTVSSLYQAAAEFELPRPIWPPDVVEEALRRAGL